MFTFNLLKSSINSVRLNQRHISVQSGRHLGWFKKESKSEEETAINIIDDEEEGYDQAEELKRISRLRDISRLNLAHKRMLHGEIPYPNAESWVHETLRYKRKLYGKMGSASNIDPRICFWTESELKEKNEYERVAFPKTVPEMIAINEQLKREKKEKILARDAEIAKNLAKVAGWKKDIQMRREKKETEARIAKERKDRLIEEVRRTLGFTVDPRDDRFKECLAAKEKEQRKAMKESKRKLKESKMMTKLLEKNKDKVEGDMTENPENDKEDPDENDDEDVDEKKR